MCDFTVAIQSIQAVSMRAAGNDLFIAARASQVAVGVQQRRMHFFLVSSLRDEENEKPYKLPRTHVRGINLDPPVFKSRSSMARWKHGIMCPTLQLQFAQTDQEADWSVAVGKVAWFRLFWDTDYDCLFPTRWKIAVFKARALNTATSRAISGREKHFIALLLMSSSPGEFDVRLNFIQDTRTRPIRWGGVCACAAQVYIFGSQQHEYISWKFSGWVEACVCAIKGAPRQPSDELLDSFDSQVPGDDVVFDIPPGPHNQAEHYVLLGLETLALQS
ncbi:hypothetical protein EVAR_9843_1 [Eumeta japonica]|uniref:Uncharacterized protein n=1 Tax=Eumeta variegata TaxID=151549 RepID=A0A4C1TQ65_EUMVA|nr:hypothetical protein EVAR_9843_1 [Eumeta japonica]